MCTNPSAIALPRRALREGFCSTKALCVCVCSGSPCRSAGTGSESLWSLHGQLQPRPLSASVGENWQHAHLGGRERASESTVLVLSYLGYISFFVFQLFVVVIFSVWMLNIYGMWVAISTFCPVSSRSSNGMWMSLCVHVYTGIVWNELMWGYNYMPT